MQKLILENLITFEGKRKLEILQNWPRCRGAPAGRAEVTTLGAATGGFGGAAYSALEGVARGRVPSGGGGWLFGPRAAGGPGKTGVLKYISE